MLKTIAITAILTCSMLLATHLNAQTQTENIRLNQVGFFSDGLKLAIAVDFSETVFSVWTSDLQTKMYEGVLSQRPSMISSCETNIKMADFTAVKKEGEYVVVIGSSKSFPFKIAGDALNEVTKAQMKYYYFNRAGMELKPEHAGKWARKAGHANDSVVIYDAQTRWISMPGGWYDAGDYGLYMVTASLAANQIMMAYEQFPEYWNKTELNIPESNNGVPDILDEVKYELKWMYKMKDPQTHGVFYKATSKTHAAYVMPDQDNLQFYCMVKNATSAFDYAATFAQAARIFKQYQTQLPGYADSCLTAAKEAWTWALANESTRPSCANPTGVTTGGYGDNVANNGNDNKVVAGVELFITTGDSTYLKPVLSTAQNGFSNNEALWSEKRPNACIELALHGDTLAKQRLLIYANLQLSIQGSNGYYTNIGNSNNDFNWGSSRRISNRGMALMAAYQVTKDKKYLHGVINSMDYILGRNATAYSFITGFGSKKVMDPHHRISDNDGVTDPQPGLPMQGPYDGSLGSGCTPREVSPCRAKNFIDNSCSFVSSELTIDQGSPNVYNLSGLMYYIGKNVVVDFIHPLQNELFKKDTSLTISIDAVSKNDSVERVQFFVNNILMAEDSTAPFSFDWNNIASSNYQLKAVAFDNLNDSAEAVIDIIVGNAAPEIRIDSPLDNFNIAPNSNATIHATASDRDGVITKVEFYINDTLKSTDASAPYEFTTDSLPAGKYSIKAIAYDDADSSHAQTITLNSACVNFAVNNEFNSGKNYWSLMLNDVAAASMNSTSTAGLSGASALKVIVTTVGKADTSILVQQDMPIYKGKTYYIAFMAKADAPCKLGTAFIRNMAPFTVHYTRTDSLSRVPKMIEFEFTADSTDEFTRLNFIMGKQLTNLYFDKVFVSECEADSAIVLITLTEETVSAKPGDVHQATALAVPMQTPMPALLWTSSDTAVARVDSTGKITAKAAGKASITVALVSKPTTKDVLTFNVLASSINAIDQLGVDVYPTIADHSIFIKNADKLNSAELYDVSGKQLVKVEQMQQMHQIDVKSLASGVYYIRLTAGVGGELTKNVKIVKVQ